MIAAMTLKFLDPFGTGKLVLFQVTYDKVGLAPGANNVVSHGDYTLGLACRGIVILHPPWRPRSKFYIGLQSFLVV
jgi:hypothetical protein